MKNIYFTPTNESTVGLRNGIIYRKNQPFTTYGNAKPHNIHIVSDEEIKEGDWVILKSGRLTKAETESGSLGFQTIDGVAFLWFREGDKKVILTTDPELIKDGIQAIEEDFIEWLVDNDKFDRVDIEMVKEHTNCEKMSSSEAICQLVCDKCTRYKFKLPKKGITITTTPKDNDYLQGFINQFEGDDAELFKNDWNAVDFLKWLQLNGFKLSKNDDR
jgi:hypothetical protein